MIPTNEATASPESEIVIEPILNEIKIKQEICNALAEARDRLLPKLMNGEIEI